jgi:hypothetical protein
MPPTLQNPIRPTRRAHAVPPWESRRQQDLVRKRIQFRYALFERVGAVGVLGAVVIVVHILIVFIKICGVA